MSKHEKLSLLDRLTQQLIELELELEEAQENEARVKRLINNLKEKISKIKD